MHSCIAPPLLLSATLFRLQRFFLWTRLVTQMLPGKRGYFWWPHVTHLPVRPFQQIISRSPRLNASIPCQMSDLSNGWHTEACTRQATAARQMQQQRIPRPDRMHHLERHERSIRTPYPNGHEHLNMTFTFLIMGPLTQDGCGGCCRSMRD